MPIISKYNENYTSRDLTRQPNINDVDAHGEKVVLTYLPLTCGNVANRTDPPLVNGGHLRWSLEFT